MNDPSSVVTFVKGMEAPCVRFAITGGSQLVLPYIHATSFELGPGNKLLICRFGETQLQIEGSGLMPLLMDLQRNNVESIGTAGTPQKGLPYVSRVVKIEPEEDVRRTDSL